MYRCVHYFVILVVHAILCAQLLLWYGRQLTLTPWHVTSR